MLRASQALSVSGTVPALWFGGTNGGVGAASGKNFLIIVVGEYSKLCQNRGNDSLY